MGFPQDFLWGAATASYQIEGSDLSHGRGECIWYRFSHTPGMVKNGDTGDVACDHLNRYPQDVQLMANLGLKAYRFSTSWPRIIPKGIGTTNPEGLDFYDKLVDELLKHNIIPFLTLYHWDLPQALQDLGGWENPDSVKWFADYTEVVVRRLGDRVRHWITHNEPWVVAFVGNWQGRHAPGKKDLPTAYRVAHHLLLSHGAAVPVIRHHVADAQVGITLNLAPQYPASDKPEDIAAARLMDGFQNRWFLDPLYKGVYPQDLVAKLGATLDGIDVTAIGQAAVPTDFLGINYYSRGVIASAADEDFGVRFVRQDQSEFTAMDWEIYPQGLTDLLLRVTQDYAPQAIYITENGAAFDEPTPVNGVIEDPRRVAYLESHFAAAQQAIEQGAPLKGYFVWSLLDNFEWAEGYDKRFGIIFVNYQTLARIPKRSALFYRDFIKAQSQ